MDIESTEKYLETIMNQFSNNYKKGNTMYQEDVKEDVKKVVKFVNAKVDPAKIWEDAWKTAVKAVDDYMVGKEEPMYCGFANVSIRPARGKFVTYLKKQGIGDSGWNGGYRISYYDIMPPVHKYRHTQSMDIKEVACDAFAKVLENQYGLTAYSESRAD